MNIIEELAWRGAINQQTDEEGLRTLTDRQPTALYCGVDPTGDSMHIGHLIPFIMLRRFQLMGHRPYILIGGGTGAIGDPSGRTGERQMQTMETVNHNVGQLTNQLYKLFHGDIKIVNNFEWLSQLSLLDFLRDYGKHVGINGMLAKDVVASRLAGGISFTEFSYQILQAIDFKHLYDTYNVQLQIGGADQWGNITAGIDMIRRLEGSDTSVFGLTIPLMLKSDGTKFGKTAGGAVWLDASKTSPYAFYQFWLNQDDKDVVRYLKYFTFLSSSEIDALTAQLVTRPELRFAQRRLADEVTVFVHGSEALKEAQFISEMLFSGNVAALNRSELEQIFDNMSTPAVSSEQRPLLQWLVDAGVCASKRQAREEVEQGAVSINGESVSGLDYEVRPHPHSNGNFVVVRKGKKNYTVVRIQG